MYLIPKTDKIAILSFFHDIIDGDVKAEEHIIYTSLKSITDVCPVYLSEFLPIL